MISSAVHAAGTALRARLVELALADPASPLHGADAETILIADGVLTAPPARRTATPRSWAHHLADAEATGSWRPRGSGRAGGVRPRPRGSARGGGLRVAWRSADSGRYRRRSRAAVHSSVLIRSSEVRIMRETWICEQPMRRAIFACSRSSEKRRRRISRADGSSSEVSWSNATRDSACSYSRSSSRSSRPGRRRGDLAVERGPAAAVGVQRLGHRLGRAAEMLGEVVGRRFAPDRRAQRRALALDRLRRARWRSRGGRTSQAMSRR